jgi:cold-inducible RNA-binding protein
MSDTLHVGNIGDAMTDDELRGLFAASGAVASARAMADTENHKPRGFGLVEMATHEGTEAALVAIHGRSVAGRTLTVRRLPARAPGWSGGNDQGGGNRSHGMDVGNGGSRW